MAELSSNRCTSFVVIAVVAT
ncbi:MAG: hypothetical protein QOH91_974, partial [Mycobacterium sp.]|nr:hypothetical protein [Mycobacterium sp.]